jgi:hypothetical protein
MLRCGKSDCQCDHPGLKSITIAAHQWRVAETTLLRVRRIGSEYFHSICPSCFMLQPTRANEPNGYLLASYRIATAPEPNSSRLTSLKSTCFDSPANNIGARAWSAPQTRTHRSIPAPPTPAGARSSGRRVPLIQSPAAASMPPSFRVRSSRHGQFGDWPKPSRIISSNPELGCCSPRAPT